MNGLLQFLQSASNTAADTVAAPVDLVGMALRKMGVPVPHNALGSSEWMKQNGLMVDVPQTGASLAGETFGLLSPAVAAAKAPQIARGLLDLGDDFQRYNQALGPAGASYVTAKTAAPPMSPRKPELWYHASTEPFDSFSFDHFGSGGFRNYAGGSLNDMWEQAMYATTSPEHARLYGDVLYELTPKKKLSGLSLEKVTRELQDWAREQGYKSAQSMIDAYYEASPYLASDLDQRLNSLAKSAKAAMLPGAAVDFGDLLFEKKIKMGKVGAFFDPDLFEWRRLP